MHSPHEAVHTWSTLFAGVAVRPHIQRSFALEKAIKRCTHRCVGCEPLADEVQPTGAHALVRQCGCVCIGVGVMEMSAKQCKLSVAA